MSLKRPALAYRTDEDEIVILPKLIHPGGWLNGVLPADVASFV